jgi:hypothetical protein
MEMSDVIATPVSALVAFAPPMGAMRCLLLACGVLAPAAAASEPAPGQPAEVLRARKRRHAAALAGPIAGQPLVPSPS